MFWLIFVKLLNSRRVFEAETIVLDASEPVGSFDSKTAHKRALFSCSGLAGGCGELAADLSVGGCETMSLRVRRLV